MFALNIEHTIVMNKNSTVPSKGIICAHPGRVRRIAEEFLQDSYLHTDYRGYQIYVGSFKDERLFVANTGIGAPAAAFILEELIAFGVKTIIRVGSDDSSFSDYCLKIVDKTTVPVGLALEYDQDPQLRVNASLRLRDTLLDVALEENLPVRRTLNKHFDGYYTDNFRRNKDPRFSSSDMESGALYLLGKVLGLNVTSILLSYPKHGVAMEGGGDRARDLEGLGINLALNGLSSFLNQ